MEEENIIIAVVTHGFHTASAHLPQGRQVLEERNCHGKLIRFQLHSTWAWILDFYFSDHGNTEIFNITQQFKREGWS